MSNIKILAGLKYNLETGAEEKRYIEVPKESIVKMLTELKKLEN